MRVEIKPRTELFFSYMFFWLKNKKRTHTRPPSSLLYTNIDIIICHSLPLNFVDKYQKDTLTVVGNDSVIGLKLGFSSLYIS
jgi:hypothetical protein